MAVAPLTAGSFELRIFLRSITACRSVDRLPGLTGTVPRLPICFVGLGATLCEPPLGLLRLEGPNISLGLIRGTHLLAFNFS